MATSRVYAPRLDHAGTPRRQRSTTRRRCPARSARRAACPAAARASPGSRRCSRSDLVRRSTWPTMTGSSPRQGTCTAIGRRSRCCRRLHPSAPRASLGYIPAPPRLRLGYISATIRWVHSVCTPTLCVPWGSGRSHRMRRDARDRPSLNLSLRSPSRAAARRSGRCASPASLGPRGSMPTITSSGSPRASRSAGERAIGWISAGSRL